MNVDVDNGKILLVIASPGRFKVNPTKRISLQNELAYSKKIAFNISKDFGDKIGCFCS